MYDLNTFPLQPPKSTERRLAHFDETVFRADPSTFIYKFVDAISGDAGAASLLKDTLMTRLSLALETIYFSDLDYIFGGMHFLERLDMESYPYNPKVDLLNSDQWDEVRIKDSWYRARIKDFFLAATLGGTPNGIRAAVQAGTSASCDIFEVWRFQDSYGLTQSLGRAPVTSRSEFVVKPHKSPLHPKQQRLLRQMVNRISPADTVVTIDPEGLQVNSPVKVQSSSADSSYFEVQKRVQGTPLLQEIPPPELLAIDLRPTEDWLFSRSPEIAPYAAFNITQEHCLAGETRVITSLGVKPIEELSGGTHKVLTTMSKEGGGGGRWVDAEFRSYGRHPLMKVVLKRCGTEKTIYATSQHRWFTRSQSKTNPYYKDRSGSNNTYRKEVLTKDLKPGHKLSYVYTRRDPRLTPSPIGIAHGFTFGDGHRDGNSCSTDLHGEKDKALLPFFQLHKLHDRSYVHNGIEKKFIQATGLPRFFKTLVDLEEAPTYLYGWLAGYFAADGHISKQGQVSMSSAKRENLEHVRMVCSLLGVHTNPIATVEWSEGDPQAYNQSPMYTVTFNFNDLPEEFYVIEEHKKNWRSHYNPTREIRDYKGYTVVSVEETDRVEEVYCSTVPVTHSFALEDNILTGNSYYYLISGGKRSPIDSVLYNTTLNGVDLEVERNYESVVNTGGFTPWQDYPLADSPDNYPGGRFGVTPSHAPARTPLGETYNFPYTSQQDYVEEAKSAILERGGEANDHRFRLPTSEASMDRVTYTPDLAIAYSTPSKDSTVTSRWTTEDTRRVIDFLLRPTQNGVGINAGIVL